MDRILRRNRGGISKVPHSTAALPLRLTLRVPPRPPDEIAQSPTIRSNFRRSSASRTPDGCTLRQRERTRIQPCSNQHLALLQEAWVTTCTLPGPFQNGSQ